MRLRGFEVSGFESIHRKSYSHSHVMARATASQVELEELLMRLADMVGRRLRAAGRQGRVVSVGIVYRPETGRLSKQSKLADPISTGDEIYQAALQLLAARDPRRLVGTLGVGLSLGASVLRPRWMRSAIGTVRTRCSGLAFWAGPRLSGTGSRSVTRAIPTTPNADALDSNADGFEICCAR
jgi:hypothetical protein